MYCVESVMLIILTLFMRVSIASDTEDTVNLQITLMIFNLILLCVYMIFGLCELGFMIHKLLKKRNKEK